MKTINLRDFYSSIYSSDCLFDVPDEVAELLLLYKRLEEAQQRRIRRHKAYYSLDRKDGIEKDIILIILTPPEIYERKLTNQEMYAAMNSLSEKQTRRVYAHYFLGMSKYAIAKAEGVDESAVRKSIETGLKRMALFLKNLA